MRWYLPAHVHMCRSSDWFVFFDIRADRYFAMPDRIGALAEDRRSFEASELTGEQLTRLQAQGLVVAAPVLVEPKAGASGMKALALTPAFVWSMLWAARGARGGRWLERALDDLAAAKQSCADVARQDLNATIEEYEVRRIWWPRKFVCLFDTLALAAFLRRRGHACDVVFGAKGRPFAAHCWAESEGRVLAEDAHFCSGFSEMVRA